jgi:hypothetical protein
MYGKHRAYLFWSAQNELVFDANELKTNPQKGRKTHLGCNIEPEFATRKGCQAG